jgi:predicted SAM-dependent methyltransferase
MKLNLGAGNEIRAPGWVNHDIRKHRPEIDVVWDLNQTPWPWEDSTFREIQAISVFEHLEITLIDAMNECWRIIHPDGRLNIKYPISTSPFIHWDPTHRWCLAPESVDFVDPETKLGREHAYYTDRHWQIVRKTVDEKGRNCWASLKPRGK